MRVCLVCNRDRSSTCQANVMMVGMSLRPRLMLIVPWKQEIWPSMLKAMPHRLPGPYNPCSSNRSAVSKHCALCRLHPRVTICAGQSTPNQMTCAHLYSLRQGQADQNPAHVLPLFAVLMLIMMSMTRLSQA